jgi:hypothetical protein
MLFPDVSDSKIVNFCLLFFSCPVQSVNQSLVLSCGMVSYLLYILYLLLFLEKKINRKNTTK